MAKRSNLRENLEKELEPGESIEWIEQPIARFFIRSTVITALAGVFALGFISFWLYGWLEMTTLRGARTTDPMSNWVRNSGEFVGIFGILIAIVPLSVPILHWLEMRGTIYAITNRRAILLKPGFPRVVQSFFPRESVMIERRDNVDGSGDLIVFTHRSKDFDNDTITREFGFKYLRNPREFEKMLRQIDRYGS
ncbi:hypothetical protein V0288_17115 [Pannus brasiliensis CCIBt3594]|uniref:Photosystem I assembly protein Ycf4 n=1 Tax=Pannus brasiliensis CCIBt3594 TaxID=1427578 RepID=A0AAW9QV27_9CHRO